MRPARALLLLCLALATAVCASTGALTARVETLLVSRSAATLGGDLLLRSSTPFAAELREQVAQAGLDDSLELSLPTVAFAGERSQLINLRGVDAQWPLRGSARTQPAQSSSAPPPGVVWVDERLATALDVGPGAQVQIGRNEFRVGAVLGAHPGQGNAGFSSLAPQALLRSEEIEAAGLLAEGARSRWYLYVAGPPAAIATLRSQAEEQGLRAAAPGEVRPEIGSALQRADRLLTLAALSSLILLAGVVFLLGRYQLPSWEYETAVLRSLGASRRALLRRLAWPWARDSLFAVAAGTALAVGVHALIGLLLARQQQLALPPAPLAPFLVAAAAGLLLSLVLLPHLLRASATPPARVLRQQHDAASHGLLRGLAWTLLCLVGLSLLLSRSLELLLAGLGLTVLGALLIGLLAWGLLRLLPPGPPLSARGQLRQQGAAAGLQAGALGLGISVLLLLAGLQSQVIAPWQAQLPADAPNRFLLNIQPGQRDALDATLREAGIAEPRIMPMVRGRLVALNGEPVSVEDFDDPETQRWINRDFNLSSAATLPTDNRLLEGDFWAPDTTEALMSADVYAVERLGLEPGSTMTLDVAGQQYEYRVTNLREVQWDSLQPNFFLLVPPAALPVEQATWLTSYYLPPAQSALDRELIGRFPNLTILDLDALLLEIRALTGRALFALQWVFGFTLLAGSLLVLTMLLASAPARRHQAAILRALGLARTRLRALTLREFALLGLLAGGGAALAAQLALATLAQRAFQMPWTPDWRLLLLPPALALLLTALLGWLMLRSTTTTPPARLLKEGA